MQEHAAETHARQRRAARQAAIQGEVAVLGIADHGVAFVREMDADLVRAAGLDRDVEQGEGRQALGHAHERDRATAVRVVGVDGAHLARAVGIEILVQGHVDHLQLFGPLARDERGVGLADRPIGALRTQVVLQGDQRFPRSRDQEQARGFLVEPMHELEELGLGPGPAQLLDDAEALAAAAVHGDAGGLVDGEQVFVLEDDRELAWRRRRHFAAVGGTHGRDAHFIAQIQTRVGAGAALVDANFARADDAVEMRLRHALQDLGEEVVQSLASRCAVDADVSHGGHRRTGRGSGAARRLGAAAAAFAPYNSLLHSAAVSI